jgi:hypothetical protein
MEDLPGNRSTSSKVRPSGIGPSIIPSCIRKLGAGRFGATGVHIKQRSPAGARWAVKEIHRIEKMRHRET